MKNKSSSFLDMQDNVKNYHTVREMAWLWEPFSRVIGDMGKMFNGCVYLVKFFIQKSKPRDNLNPDLRFIFKYN